jgi:hypothetical protein
MQTELALGAIFFATVLAATAAAQEGERAPEEVEAEQEFTVAEEAYNDDRWGQAAEHYQRSYDLLERIDHPRRGLVAFNIGKALAHLPGRERDAIRAFQLFLDQTTESASDPEGSQRRSQARAQIAELESRIGGSISPVGPIIAGIGGAIAIAGIGTGIAALLQHDDIVSQCPDGICPPELADDAETAETLALATDVLLPIGIAAAVAGVVLTFVLTEGGPTATATVRPDRASLSLTWSLQ